MKFFSLISIPILSLEICCLLLTLCFIYNFNKKLVIQKNATTQETITQQIVNKPTSIGPPISLTIPTINVHANIQNLGVTSGGDMEVPSNIVDVGWFKFGSRPGEKGSAVIVGHFDGENGKGIFANLNKLKKGDELYVEDSNGTSFVFVVRESHIYDPGYKEDVFSLNDSVHLNLITCDGVWDKNKKRYNKRLVVFTDLKTNI